MAAASTGSIEALLVQRYPGVRVVKQATVQSLWGGYGQILRLHLEPSDADAPRTVVVKRVAPPPDEGGLSHERKCRSYVVEQLFYETCAARLDPTLCRVPALLCSGASLRSVETLLVLEDLDADDPGFGGRRHALSVADARACMVWLAHFHRTFLVTRGTVWPEGMWEQVRWPGASREGKTLSGRQALILSLYAMSHV